MSEFCAEINEVDYVGLFLEVVDGLNSCEWRESFDLAQKLKVGVLSCGVLPPENMPKELFDLVTERYDGYFADVVSEKWELVQVPFGFTQAILVAELKPDFPLGKISYAEMTQNSAQCIMNLCAVLQERDGEFIIPSTFIADWLGLKQQVAWAILKRLEKKRVLS